MSGKASQENGRKGGHKKGQKNAKTIEREKALAEYQQMVIKRLKPIFEKQYTLVDGITYLYRIDENKHGGKEHVIVDDPQEIGDILAQAHDDGGFVEGVYNDKFYYITVRPPDNSAIKDMLDRAVGKAPQSIDHTTNGKDLPTPILNAIPSDNETEN